MKPTLAELAGLKGASAIKYLMEHKQQLFAQKKAMFKTCDPVSYVPPLEFYKGGQIIKADSGTSVEDADTLNVTVVGNACWLRDSHGDVGIPGCYTKSIKENRFIHQLADHNHSIYAQIGDMIKAYTKQLPLTELGLGKEGSTECLMFDNAIMRELNEKAFMLYKTGRVKQHSIGLLYIKLLLAVNDKDYEQEHGVWQKYIDNIINKKETKDYGYFWAMEEIRVIENSAVLFGANPLTPTISIGKSDTEEEPGNPTQAQPSTHKTAKKKINFGALVNN